MTICVKERGLACGEFVWRRIQSNICVKKNGIYTYEGVGAKEKYYIILHFKFDRWLRARKSKCGSERVQKYPNDRQ